ncbi:ATP-binding protein [Phocoenobacter skyensis]|uniref:Histidine kinase-, DNA gyrase B-, and HSP90-like ATPase n=1 Tax=Phocoenobacter skyensis TaxID=97481 RepID=A0A1H7XNN3_9PAST|nr:ATP-binding protein [Pasteurella skyensis]MDP8185765.1 ATP-binding protein [Pasteurella skyensis]QLB22652.1 hypothetical protein A6B44_05295 [Pasteurella skyensis]SEM35244.1 Histidine kinase-, DNA gyrase B-, and HSP90-like ATPase [Pasteurella skyensis]
MKTNYPTSVDVSPDMQFYNLLESYPYTVKGALCEYIDNALEAFRSARTNGIPELPSILTINISIQKDHIIIEDDGVGIAFSDIERAMKPAYKPSEQSLNEFGIGMKAASMWFGRAWSLESYPIDSDSAYRINFDLNQLLENNQDRVALEKIERKKVTSGVRITLSKLTQQIEKNQALRAWEEIDETYQLFTSRDNPILRIYFKYQENTFPKKDFSELPVSNQPLVFPVCRLKDGQLYTIGKKKLWKKDVSFEFNGKEIKGFFSLGSEASQVKNPGLRLFRYGRLIKGMEVNPYRPVDLVGTANKATPSRFYAELHLDGQAISNSKGEFTFDEYLFLSEFKKQEGIEDFLQQAVEYRSRKAVEYDFIACSDWEDYYKKSGSKEKQQQAKKSSKPTTKSTKLSQTKNQHFKKNSPIILLKRISAPETYTLLDNFIDDAIWLYEQNRIWAFCLVYRTILEVSIIDKLKAESETHYEKARDKSIVALYKYLQSNSHIIPDNYETLKRVMKENNRASEPFVGLLNLTSHGRCTPTKVEIDDLIRNTQQLLQWAFDREC